MKNMTLAEWLRNNGYEASLEAGQIWVGQNLTQEEAIRVRRMLNRAYLDSEGLQVFGDWVEFTGKDHIPFLKLLLSLINEGPGRTTSWGQALYDTITLEEVSGLNN